MSPFYLLSFWPCLITLTSAFNIWPSTAPNETVKIGPEITKQDGNQVGCDFYKRNAKCYIVENILNVYLV